eukprot:GHVL01032555.1.p2 GENE.GHVL01032555.1~~GHVL01032555.1.p2  ORF type:complete len:137 (+),score=25.68 GHVL01032555.1:71-481(+)
MMKSIIFIFFSAVSASVVNTSSPALRKYIKPEPFIAMPTKDGGFKKIDVIDIDVQKPEACEGGPEKCRELTVFGETPEVPAPLKRLRLRGNITPSGMRKSADEMREYAEALERTADMIEDAEDRGDIVEFAPVESL